MRLQVKLCANSSSNKVICATPEEQKLFFAKVTLELIFINQYFDYNDLKAPVKNYIDDTYFFFLSEKQIFTMMNLIPSLATLS